MKKKKDTDDIFKQKTQLVGGMLPRPLADKFSLVCLYLNKSRSSIITDLLGNYIEILEKEGRNETYMIKALAHVVCDKLWKSEGKNKAKILKQAEQQLRRKKINPAYRERIITLAKELYSEGDKWKSSENETN